MSGDWSSDVCSSDLRGAALVARGRVIRPGRRLIVSGAEVFARAGDGTETLIAVMTGTLVPVAQTAG